MHLIKQVSSNTKQMSFLISCDTRILDHARFSYLFILDLYVGKILSYFFVIIRIPKPIRCQGECDEN